MTWDEYERFLERRLAVAESRAQNSYHCRTADCLGWCVYEDDVNEFRCPICWALNCLVCKVGPAGDTSDPPPWLGLGARQSGGTLTGDAPERPICTLQLRLLPICRLLPRDRQPETSPPFVFPCVPPLPGMAGS